MMLAQRNVFEPRLLTVAKGRGLQLGPQARIMGILNVTPDSFSDGGLDPGVDAAVARARTLVSDGADIIDIGGESTRPGADPVRAIEEQRRVLPVIAALAGEGGYLISIDTYRSETARLALEAGAHMVNDVWGLQYDPTIASVAADFGAGVCIMHTGRGRERLADPIADQFAWFTRSLDIARKAGIEAQSLLLDPGFGFAKEELDDNLALIGRFAELHGLGLPLMAGTSRKRFIGTMTGRDAGERDAGTAATSAMLRLAGAGVFRVHNVAINRDALAVADAMVHWSLSQEQTHG
ncbi:dihydropteroate synthase [Hoeflea marina]|uniref:Dihydropteroate synthase n=2 Tax=Hoeflea marina TaxID=274592 RepID=A0A317PSH8_9HYPH|nr:dihydropteroate synthase [Hoeflea marina]